MDRLKTGFGTLMLFLSVQAAGFFSPAHAATPAPAPAEGATHAAGDIVGAAKTFIQTLERAADDAFAFSFFEAPLAPQSGADVPLGQAPMHFGPIDSFQPDISLDFGFADQVDLAALVKSAVDSAQGDWMF